MLWVWLVWAVGLSTAFQRLPLSNLDYQPKCQNDGFFMNNETCSCKPYFSGDSCEKRTCMNGGHNYEQETDRCVCPPGFLGANCEPRACLGNVEAVFNPPTSRRSATFVFTWTPDMVKKINESQDDFLEYIGTKFEDLRYSEMHFIVPDRSTQFNIETKDDYQKYKDFFENFVCDAEEGYCPIDNMPYNTILGAVRSSSPRSPVYIFTNIKLDSQKDTYFQQIIQEATMMGVTINTILYGPPKINYPTVYSEPGFAEYGDLAAATGGFYMTPYDPSKNAPLGNLSVTASFGIVHDMITTTYPIHMDPVPELVTYYSENGRLYFTFRSNDTTAPDFNLQVIVPVNKRLSSTDLEFSDAGYSKIYMLDMGKSIAPNTKSILALLQTSSSGRVWGVRIYGQPAFPLGLGISTAIQVDASHPHAVPIQERITGPNMLVSAGEGISFLMATNWDIIANSDGSLKRSEEDSCLFPSILGTIKSCEKQTFAWIQVQNSNQSTGMIPFYCGDAYYKSSNPPNQFRDRKRSKESEIPRIPKIPKIRDDSNQCFQPPPPYQTKYVKQDGPVIFGLVVEDNPKITNDFLRNPNNIFVKLIEIWDSKSIGITSVANGAKNYTFSATGNIADVMDNVLNNLDDKNPSTNTNFFSAIKAATQVNKTAMFYDLFVVGLSSSVFTLDLEKKQEFEMLQYLYEQRIRLHWLWIKDTQVTSNDQDKPFDYWSRRLAAATGGLSHLFDDAKEAARFINNFDWLFGNELVYSQELNYTIEIITPFQLTKNEIIYVVLDSPATTPREVAIKGNDLEEIEYSPSDRQMTIYSFTNASESGTYYMKIEYPILKGEPISIRVYSSRESLYSIAFASGDGTTNLKDGDMYGPIFGKAKQFPIFAVDEDNIPNESSTFTIALQTDSIYDFKPLQTNGAIVKNECGSSLEPFLYFFSYNWVCSEPRGLYQLQLSSSKTSTTRAFSFICNQENPTDNGACGYHGTSYKDKGECECKAGWTGPTCDKPDCQNGGTPLSGNTCNCTGTGAIGFFCEYATNTTCLPEDVVLPEYHSTIGSLILVIEESQMVWSKILSWMVAINKMSRDDFQNKFQSTHIVLVTYNDKMGVTRRLSTTDPKALKNAVDGSLWETSNGDKNEAALITALKLQVTERSLVLWVSNKAYTKGYSTTDEQRDLFKMIADRRADVRIYVADPSNPLGGDPLFNKLGMISVSVPVPLKDDDDFNQIFNQYVYPSLSPNTKFAPILTTIDYSTDCKPDQKTLFIAKNNAWFVTTLGLTVKVTDDDDHSVTPKSIGSSILGFDGLDQGQAHTFTFTSTDTTCGYSIEILGEEQVAFGVSTNMEDQETLAPILNSNQDNYLNIRWSGVDVPPYSTPESAFVADFFQNVQQWPVVEDDKTNLYTIDYTIPGINIVALTHNLSDTHCIYPFLPKMSTCDNDTTGFVTRIYSPSMEDSSQTVQKMVYLPCIDLSTRCQNGGIYDGSICNCVDGWLGYDCSIPSCENGGIRDGTVCNCPKGFIGPFCQEPDPCTPRRSRTLIFLFDPTVSPSAGDIEALGDVLDPLRDAIVKIASRYDVVGKNAFMALGEVRRGLFDPITDPSLEVSSKLDDWKATTSSWKDGKIQTDVKDIIGGFPEKVDLRRLFLLTKQKGIKATPSDDFFKSLKDFGFQIMIVGFDTDVSQLEPWGDTATVSTADEFVKLAIEFNEGYDCPQTTTISSTAPTTTPISLCTMNARADIAFMIDATFNQSEITLLYNVLTNFYANISMASGTIKSPTDFCTDQSQWDDSWNTRVSGMNYYKDTYKGNPPNYCVDSSQQLASSTKGIKPSNMTITNMSKIVQVASILLEGSCKCRRWTNSSVLDPRAVPQIMIWIPYTPKYDIPSTAFPTTQLYSFKHYLLPYKFKTSDALGTMWSNMEEIKLPSTPNMNRKDIVQALWDLLCEETGNKGDRPIAPDVWNPPEIFMEDDEMGFVDGGLDETKENQQDAQIPWKSLNERESQQREQDPPQREENTRSRLGFSFLGWEF